MINKAQLFRRLMVMLLVLMICSGAVVLRLYSLQIAGGEENVRRAALRLTTSATISAARGELLDRYGRPMVTNEADFSLALIYSSWEKQGQYERLLRLVELIEADRQTDENGAQTRQAELCDALPISKAAPYTYDFEANEGEKRTYSTYLKDSADTLGLTAVSEAVAQAKQRQQDNPRTDENGDTIDEVDALDATELVTPSEFLRAMQVYLVETQDFPTGLTDAQARTLVGLYYSMRTKGFSLQVTFTLAKGVSLDLIAEIKEHQHEYVGVEVDTAGKRVYKTDLAAHLIGLTGAVNSEEWTGKQNGGPYQDKDGYNMNDDIGKTGLESALEPYLHGTAGTRSLDSMLGGSGLDTSAEGSDAKPGENVITTIDLSLQSAAEKALATRIPGDAYGAAAVVLKADTSEVLAMASYPTYSLANYKSEIKDLVRDELHTPLVNRATSGVYTPGSAFKPLSAVAGLETGIIHLGTTVTCTGEFEYGGQIFRCQNHSVPMQVDLQTALKYSCNTFFYSLGRDLGGDELEKWCAKFGLGQPTGIEIGEEAGRAAGPTYREKMLEQNPELNPWLGGDDVQAAIGQSENGFTPLQLANYMACLVNGGTLHRPTLVRTIKSADYNDKVKDFEPEVIGTVQFSELTQAAIIQGMSEVTNEGGTAGQVFADYPIRVGGKTGTAETSRKIDEAIVRYNNSVFVAFAPLDKPEIVVCVVGEGLSQGTPITSTVRDIMDEYFGLKQAQNSEDGEEGETQNETAPQGAKQSAAENSLLA